MTIAIPSEKHGTVDSDLKTETDQMFCLIKDLLLQQGGDMEGLTVHEFGEVIRRLGVAAGCLAVEEVTVGVDEENRARGKVDWLWVCRRGWKCRRCPSRLRDRRGERTAKQYPEGRRQFLRAQR